jgi:hypothetical protein
MKPRSNINATNSLIQAPDWIMWMRHFNNKSYLSYDKFFASISDRRKWTPTCKYAFPLNETPETVSLNKHMWAYKEMFDKL